MKVQEKVIADNGKVRVVKSYGVGKKGPYFNGDNQWYWLHCKNKEDFYLIPEHVMAEHGLIGGTRYSINIKSNACAWLERFKHNYTTVKADTLFNASEPDQQG